LCVHAALLRFAAQDIVYSLEVHEARGDQAEFMKQLAERAYANWKKLGRANHPGWSILSQEDVVPTNAEQFAELQPTCVSGHHEVGFWSCEAINMPTSCSLLARRLHTHLLQHAARRRKALTQDAQQCLMHRCQCRSLCCISRGLTLSL
jgi:hypothetical protein